MTDIAAGAQIFDLIFHPTSSIVYTGLLTGHIKAFSYDDQGNHKRVFSLRPSKRSCRALAINEDGSQLYAGGKSKALNIIDTSTENIDIRAGAHGSPINRIKYLMPWLLTTGDDDGVIKLWDPRQRDCARTYKQHFDYITDFLWLEDKKHLVATSGDGTLSLMDVRSKKPEPIAQSEDQEDELLSIALIKGGTKVVVGTQLGILSIFNRSSGWGDCVDRVPGHPHSIDALSVLPSSFPGVDTSSTVLTGSSDGFVRAVQILPTKLLGVVADHGDWPVERIAIGSGTGQLTLEGGDNGDKKGHIQSADDDEEEEAEVRQQQHSRWWVGSVGHDEILKLTDLETFFREPQEVEAGDGEAESVDEEQNESGASDEEDAPTSVALAEAPAAEAEKGSDSDSDRDQPELGPKKRKRKKESNPLVGVKNKKGKNTVDAEPAFFDGL